MELSRIPSRGARRKLGFAWRSVRVAQEFSAWFYFRDFNSQPLELLRESRCHLRRLEFSQACYIKLSRVIPSCSPQLPHWYSQLRCSRAIFPRDAPATWIRWLPFAINNHDFERGAMNFVTFHRTLSIHL